MPKEKEKTQGSREKMISIYDPTVNAFREVPISLAKKFIESAKDVEQKLKEEK